MNVDNAIENMPPPKRLGARRSSFFGRLSVGSDQALKHSPSHTENHSETELSDVLCNQIEPELRSKIEFLEKEKRDWKDSVAKHQLEYRLQKANLKNQNSFLIDSAKCVREYLTAEDKNFISQSANVRQTSENLDKLYAKLCIAQSMKQHYSNQLEQVGPKIGRDLKLIKMLLCQRFMSEDGDILANDETQSEDEGYCGSFLDEDLLNELL